MKLYSNLDSVKIATYLSTVKIGGTWTKLMVIITVLSNAL